MTQNKFKIAITGGIGSGKSTVAKIISEQGYKVLSCDEIYGQLLKDEGFLKLLTNEFGDILTGEGQLDRAKLSAIVFNDKEKLQCLNNITHTSIMNSAYRQMEEKGICFLEVPLLFEGGYEKDFDAVIVVLRDIRKRIHSVTQRDKIEENAVISRINNQINYDNINLTEYYVIHNNSDYNDLRKKVLEILNNVVEFIN